MDFLVHNPNIFIETIFILINMPRSNKENTWERWLRNPAEIEVINSLECKVNSQTGKYYNIDLIDPKNGSIIEYRFPVKRFRHFPGQSRIGKEFFIVKYKDKKDGKVKIESWPLQFEYDKHYKENLFRNYTNLLNDANTRWLYLELINPDKYLNRQFLDYSEKITHTQIAKLLDYCLKQLEIKENKLLHP